MSEPIIADASPNDGREWDCQCARCGSSVAWIGCGSCTDGYSGHDCGEDTCCCADPDDNVECDSCGGAGGWNLCLSSADYCETHPLPDRHDVDRGEIEWFAIPVNREGGA